jgi:glycosyltransferase involved in cell wall biosynthesis
MKVCFLGGARYNQPLDATSAKKFRVLNALGDLFIIGFSNEFKPRIFKEHAQFYLLPKMPFPALRYVELVILGQMLTFWLIVRHQIQVVVAQSPYEGFVAALAIKLARWCGCKAALVVEVHGDFESSLFLYRRIKLPRLYRFVMNSIACYSIERADVLRTISDSTREQFKRWAPAKTIVQFPAWTDIETFLRAGETIHDDSQTIIYAGVLTPLKGIHHLIDAFGCIAAKFPSAQLLIVGKDENRTYAADLKKQVAKLGLDGRVQFLGALPQSELAKRMAKASVLVLPSKSEGLGRVVIEAMATGTPVIGSRVGGIPELVEDGVNGFLVTPGDESALAEKMRWLLENTDEARAMGRRGRVFAERSFSTDCYLKAYKQIFELAQPRSVQRQHAASTL